MATPRLLLPPPRTRRTWFTLAGSVLLHGSIIAVAALWPVHDTPPAAEIVTTITDTPGEAMLVALPAGAVDDPAPAVEQPAPPSVEVAADTPPTSEDPSMDIESAPLKLVPKPAVSRPRPIHASTTMTTPGGRAQPGAPGGTASVPGAIGGHAGLTGGPWRTPRPPYPYPARAMRVQGSGSVRITTDGTGRVTGVSVVQSTGNTMLDDNTDHYARAYWSGPPNASTTVPITYQLQ